MTESRIFQSLWSEWVRADREGKRTKAAGVVASAAIVLQTMDEVAEFMTRIRVRAGVQDFSMLPDENYYINRAPYVNDGDYMLEVSRGELLDMLTASSDARVSWPNVFSYGTAVFYTSNGRQYRASTKDFGPSETYLSS